MENQVISVQQEIQPSSPIDSFLMVAEEAEKRIEAIKKIKTIALKVTNESDWVDQGGRPYLVSSGAEKVARLFGVGWRDLKFIKEGGEDEKGKFYMYSCIGLFTIKGQTIEAVGTCSSRDPFFAKKGGDWIPVHEVDEPNIKKSAYSNCIVNGITRLLGIRNLTWEEITATGLNKEKVGKVNYAKGAQGGNTSSKDEAEVQTELWSWLMDMSEKDPNTAAMFLETTTQFTGKDGKVIRGVKSIKSLTGKRLEIAYGKIKQEHMKWLKTVTDSEAPDNTPEQPESNGSL